MRSRGLVHRAVLLLVLCALWVSRIHADDAPPPPVAAETVAAEDGKAVSKIETRRKELAEEKELLRLFADTLQQVKSKYVDAKVSDRELIEAAIRGMISKLDPYSNFIPPEELEQFRRGVEREYAGIGIHVAERDGHLQIISPMFGTPAWRAGLRSGDRILKIGNTSTRGLSINESISLMTGKPGSTVTISVLHPDEKVAETVALKREIIRMPTVLGYRRLDDGQWDYFYNQDKKTAYIRLTAFSRNTARDLARVLRKLKTGGMTSLVLDMRFNPGGLLPEAIEVCDLFLRSGRIVSTEGRGVASQTWDATAEGTVIPEGMPVAVIVNRFSASAAEIVSACLQDHHVAVVVGERTWGKGSVQNIILLENQTSALKLTTASYQRPSGTNIHRLPDATEDDEWGVRPDDGFDIQYSLAELYALNSRFDELDDVAQPTPETATPETATPETAVTEPEKPAPEKPAPEKPAPEKPAPEKPATRGDGGEEGPFVDRQLQKAVEYVEGRLESSTSPSEVPDASANDGEPAHADGTR